MAHFDNIILWLGGVPAVEPKKLVQGLLSHSNQPQKDPNNLYHINPYGVRAFGECQWVKGMPTQGRLVTIWDNKWKNYEGQFDDRYLMTGRSNWKNENGHTYEGKFKVDKFHGQGKYTWSDGKIYEGEWKEGKSNGQGKQTWPDGRTYNGEWRNDNIISQGKCIYPDDRSYVGEYKNDQYNRQGKYTFPDGCYMEDQNLDDKQIGQHLYYSKEGKLLEQRTYENGELIKTKDMDKRFFGLF